jgi:hypothetical protein
MYHDHIASVFPLGTDFLNQVSASAFISGNTFSQVSTVA